MFTSNQYIVLYNYYTMKGIVFCLLLRVIKLLKILFSLHLADKKTAIY